jgi:beta-lactamase regulating signal transducer with metallopeptidase domain
MNSLLENLSGPAWENAAVTLLHTLWQGALAALLLYLVLRWIPARRQNLRYALSLAALGGIVLGGLVTWSVLSLEPPQDRAAVPAATAAISSQPDRLEAAATIAESKQIVHGFARVGRGTDAETEPHAAASSPESGRNVWSSLLVICWLAGVSVMLVRMIASVAGAQRLARSPEVADPLVLSAVDELRERMRIARRIRVVAAEAVSSPAVLGAIWPTLLLPASLMTGVTPDQWRALLAHELAHIRRYDYLVNLAGMFIEAVLFFNPAVWWISRRVRAEREACCDALAVAATGEPQSYAEALADWAERSRAAVLPHAATLPHAAVAMTRGTERGTLLDRIQRLLVPGYQPQLRLSWAALVALLLSGVIVLAGLWRGTTAVVALAAEVLSPAERIEKLEQVQQEYGPPLSGDAFEGKVTVTGRLRTFDGQPLPEKIQAHAVSQRSGYSSSGTLDQPGATFSYELPGGIVFLRFAAEGYAPLITGPLRPDEDGRIAGLDLVLQPGFRGEVRVVDAEDGQPVAGAVLKGNVPVRGSYPNREWKTGRDGIVVIEHASERPYAFRVQAPGFQLERYEDVRLSPDKSATLKLRRGLPTTGVVVAPDGEPISGATIRPLLEHSSGGNHDYGESGPVLATTGDSGEFTIEMLNDGSIYTLWIEADRHGPKIVQDVAAGMTDLTLEVGPELSLTGEITGDLSKLRTVRGSPYVDSNQQYQIQHGDGSYGGMTSERADVEIADGVGRFQFRNLLPGEITLRVGGRTVRTEIRRPGEKISIDLDEKPEQPRTEEQPAPAATRTVVLRFVPPDDGPPPTGTVFVSGAGQAERLELEHGRVELEVEAPGSVYYRPEDLVGYWFKAASVEVEASEGPAELEIPLVPAGAIYGQVLNPDGTPASAGISISAVPVSKPPELEHEAGLDRHNVRVDVEGRFFVTPLPLGGTWRVKAAREQNVQFSEIVDVSGAEPAPRVTVRMIEPVAIEGTVLDSGGQPAPRIPVALELSYAPGRAHSWSPELSDRYGRFRFEVNPAAGEYHAEIKPRQDYVPTTQLLRTGGEPTVIRLEPGAVLNGKVLNAAGAPVPRVEVYAMPAERRAGDPIYWDAEAPTDDEGRFRFSTLAEGRAYDIRTRGFREQNPREHEGLIAGEHEAIVIRGAP